MYYIFETRRLLKKNHSQSLKVPCFQATLVMCHSLKNTSKNSGVSSMGRLYVEFIWKV